MLRILPHLSASTSPVGSSHNESANSKTSPLCLFCKIEQHRGKMASIVIMDDNRSAGILLKKALEYDDHQVDLVASLNELERKTVHPLIDLVLIHQTHQNNSGWRAFDQFKCINHNIPALLYVLPDFRQASMAWIVKAVQEALTLMKKAAHPASRWTWGSGFDDIRLDH